jgi:hypothetical protein
LIDGLMPLNGKKLTKMTQMIFCQAFKKMAKIPIYLSALISYKTAFAISFLIHGLAFVILAFLLNSLEFSDLREAPLVIDFVSAPRGEVHRTPPTINNKNTLQPNQLNNLVLDGSHTIKLRNRLLESELLAIPENENDNSTNQEQEASQESNQKQQSKFNQPYLASVFVPPSLKLPRIDMTEPKLLPAKMPISEREGKNLVRKIEKLAENLHELGQHDTTIVVENGNQLFEVQIQHHPAIEYRKEIQASSFFIIGDRGAKSHVKGTVKGKILVYTADDILIDDDLFYARPPDKFTNSDDYLGLVSEKNIKIAPLSITGAGDLHIYAAMYARGWFRIPNLNGNGEATLYIYGSLSAGCLSATEPRYATRIRFDNRLKTQRPPNFPVTEHCEIVEWDREWEVKKN